MTESEPHLSAVTGSSRRLARATATSPGTGTFAIARNGGTLARCSLPGLHGGRRNRTW